jgi:hypothetical protein
VSSLPVVDDLKVLEDRDSQLKARVPALTVEQFDLRPRASWVTHRARPQGGNVGWTLSRQQPQNVIVGNVSPGR